MRIFFINLVEKRTPPPKKKYILILFPPSELSKLKNQNTKKISTKIQKSINSYRVFFYWTPPKKLHRKSKLLYKHIWGVQFHTGHLHTVIKELWLSKYSKWNWPIKTKTDFKSNNFKCVVTVSHCQVLYIKCFYFCIFYVYVTRASAEGLGDLWPFGPLPSGGNFVFLSFCLSVFLYFCIFAFLPFCLFAFLYFWSFCPFVFFVFLSFCLSDFLSFCLFVFCLFVFLKQGPNPKICSERLWLPILKILWHFTIGSAVWVLELCEVVGGGGVVVVVGKSFVLF